MKLAYFSPLNPQPSGISDYSEELLPHLSRFADLTLFISGFTPSNPDLLNHFRWHDYQKDPSSLASLNDYDAIIYHMGNDHRYHSGMLETMDRHPGIVVFHDFALHDFFLGLAQQKKDLRIYLDELEICHGQEEAQRAAGFFLRGCEPPQRKSPLRYPLNRRLARSARGVIAHSEWSRSRLGAIAPGVPTAKINMPIDTQRFSSRTVTATANKPIQIASFGLIIPGKGVERAIKALASLRSEYDFHYTLVGGENSFFEIHSLIDAHQMRDRVSITGHISLDDFQRRMAETDVAINLRERTVGETSASLCRLMSAGVATLVSDVGWYSELPNNSVVKIPLDDYSDTLLLAYLRRLMDDHKLRQSIGENARSFIKQEHDIEAVARHYVSFIEQVRKRGRSKLIAGVATEIAALGMEVGNQFFPRRIAEDVAAITHFDSNHRSSALITTRSESETSKNQKIPLQASPIAKATGRLPRIEGIDYKHAAREYLGRLNEERRHHLRTKPFYNLRNKPAKYKNPGMDEDMHRHFCDFANIAVQLALPPGSRILEVGCGSGWLCEYFARLGYEVKGIDISPTLIDMSRERVDRVPYGVDHETPLRCTFEVHDIELEPLEELFDAIVCYDSLHHFVDDRSVMRNLACMLPAGGQLFILEGKRPTPGSSSEAELVDVMREFQTLESPFDENYLRALLDENGFAITGDFVSVNGLFDRETVEGQRLPLTTLLTDYYYYLCQKVCDNRPASSVPDSRAPGILRASISLTRPVAAEVAPGSSFVVPLLIENTGDTLWRVGPNNWPGVVVPAVKVFDDKGVLVIEFHGEPPLPHSVVPGQSVRLDVNYMAPQRLGKYRMIVDLVDQHVAWFQQKGSEPLVFEFEVVEA